MTTLAITHTRESGTLIDGTSRGDTAAIAVLKANRWRWGRSIGQWFVPQSRDRNVDSWRLKRTVEGLRAAGYEVVVTVDDTARPTAEVEADKAARQADRVEALEAKADRKRGAADAAWKRDAQLSAALPPGGEPIKVGHHSERRHRNAIDKSWKALGKAVAAEDESKEAVRRAASAAHTTEYRNNPGVTMRRIAKLEADRRRFERDRDGKPEWHLNEETGKHFLGVIPASGRYRERLVARIAELTDQIDYWRGVIEAAKADGAKVFDRSMVSKGDHVYDGRDWYQVRRVNPKSVTVPHPFIERLTWTISYDRIKDVKSDNQIGASE